MPFQKHLASNTFTMGMRQDRTYAAQDNHSYREAYNGNIVFSGNGDASFCNEPGNYQLASNSLPSGYYPVGGCELRDYTVVFSTNNTNSEIGKLELNPDGTAKAYTTLFNDAFDPNSDLLGFSFGHPILPCEPTFESIDKQRVYWLQDNKEPRCFNTVIGLTANSPEFINGNYTKLTATNKYPVFYSVHSMSLQCDWNMGLIKLKETTSTSGSLKTGMYELCYREVSRDGYNTPWSPLTRHFFVTLDGTIVSYHDRQMSASNLMTNKAYKFTIKGVDTRFYKLEVAYVYSTDRDVTQEASIFYSQKIDPTVADVDVTFSSTTGIAVSMAEFNRYIVPIRRGSAVGQKDNRLAIGGIETYGPYKLDLSTVTAAINIKSMFVDESTKPQTVPFTNVSQTNTPVTVELYKNAAAAAVTESHAITADYANYKGVQYEHLFSSYWGGETYPFSVVVFDLKGNPWYAQHLFDYTFPNRYDNAAYQLMTLTTGYINIMGLKLSGIDLTPILFDSDGKLQVSGVAICRGKRIPNTVCQGVLFPATIEDNPDVTHPLNHSSNDFHGTGAGFADSLRYQGGDSVGQHINSRPYTSHFISPDVLFGRNPWEGTQQDDVLEEADKLDIVALYDCPYTEGTYPRTIVLNPAAPLGAAANVDGYQKFYTKNYEINVDAKNLAYGTKSRLKRLLTIDSFVEQDTEWEHYDKDDQDLFYTNDANFDVQDVCANNNHSRGVLNSWLIKHKDYKNTTYYAATANADRPRYYVANYKVNNTKYFTSAGQKSLAERLYIGTGHFQPINATVLAAILSGGRYILNDVEIWGGDCYPWIFDFTRLYPAYSGACTHTGTCWGDYGMGHIIPLESTMNFALRRGRSLAHDGIRSEAEACGGTDYFINGITQGQPEEFNLNSVVMHEGNVQSFIAMPEIVDPVITKFDYRWLLSNLKVYGEITDQYRTFLTSNRGDMEPNMGKIIGRGYLFDYMYCLQERGFSRLRINEIHAITTESGEAISTGVVTLWQKPDIKSTIHGSLHPFAIINTDKAIYWPDYFNKCFCRFAQDGVTNLSEQGEMKEWSDTVLKQMDRESTTNPISLRHIEGGWDSKREIIYWSLQAHDVAPVFTDITVSYSTNPKIHSFVSFWDWAADVFVNCKGFLLSTSYQVDATHLYTHYKGNAGQYYGTYRRTSISFITNPMSDVDKLFDNAWANMNADGYSLLENIYWTTDNQSQSMALAADTRSEYRNLIFRNETVQRNSTVHLSGKTLLTKYSFLCAANKVIQFTSHDQSYRPIAKTR